MKENLAFQLEPGFLMLAPPTTRGGGGGCPGTHHEREAREDGGGSRRGERHEDVLWILKRTELLNGAKQYFGFYKGVVERHETVLWIL